CALRRKGARLGAFLMNQRFSSVTRLASLLHRVLISKGITPASTSFEILNGIRYETHHLRENGQGEWVD
ncbi:MAG: hypothetical protein ACI9FG_000961, partial [Crocinitomicaceae bacterium]